MEAAGEIVERNMGITLPHKAVPNPTSSALNTHLELIKDPITSGTRLYSLIVYMTGNTLETCGRGDVVTNERTHVALQIQ